ncbi:SPOR domain-containing protein [candidate division WOR-3 bacterium]|nr:SPOR domain-containing protein [candidate division WOR-3 bacterium]
MIRYFGIFLLIGLLIGFGGCKRKTTKTQKLPVREEELGKSIGYVFTENDVYTINLEKDSILNKFKLPSLLADRIKQIGLSKDTLWIAGEALFQLVPRLADPLRRSFSEARASARREGDFKRVCDLPKNCEKVIKKGENIYVLTPNKISELLGKRTIQLKESVTKFVIDFNRIWVLNKSGLYIYKLIDFEKEAQIPLSNITDFAIAPYGLRLYIGRSSASGGLIDVFDTQTFALMTSIKINGTPIVLKFTPGSNKLYCLTSNELYVIKRVTNRVEKRLPIRKGKKLFLSRDGSYGIIVEENKVSFFDTGTDELICQLTDTLFLKLSDLVTSFGDSRVYYLTPDELIVINSNGFKVQARLKIKGGKKIIIKAKKPYPLADRPSAESVKQRIFTKTSFFTIQVGSSRNYSNAEQLAEFLRLAYYPAWVSKFGPSDEGWYRIRVGLFNPSADGKKDAEIIKEKLKTLVNEIMWIAKTSIIPSEIPSIGLRDVNGNGLTNEAVQLNGKRIIIYEVQNGVYAQIYSLSKEIETYTGQPEFKNIDEDKNLEIITPTIEKEVYSIIDFRDGGFIESINQR